MLTLENAAKIYSVFNGVKFGTSDEQEKYQLYRQFVAYLCDSCSIAPVTDYANNNFIYNNSIQIQEEVRGIPAKQR